MSPFFSKRTIKYGSSALTAILIALGIFAVINFLSMRYHIRMDWTARGLYTLSPKTISVLESLNSELNIVAFYRQDEQAAFAQVLKQFAYHSDRLSYRFIDPDKEPVETRRYKVTDYGTSIIEYDNREERIQEDTEKALTNAIARITTNQKRTVYFLGGHDEAHVDDQSEKGYKRAKQLLIEGNNDVRPPLVLAQVQRVPDDCDLLIVAGPKTAFLPAEVAGIADYLDEGGAVMFLLDPLVTTGLEPMLRNWSIGLRNDFVVDKSDVLPGADFSVPVAAKYGKHPITDKHSGLMTFYPLVRSMERVGSLPGTEVSSLVLSSPHSWSETDLGALREKRKEAVEYTSGEDRVGPLWLAMAVLGPVLPSGAEQRARRQPRARIVVFGDSDFVTNQFVDVAGNGDLFMNAINWLLNERDQITIRPKQAKFRPLELSPGDEFWLRWVYWLVMPIIPIGAGVIVWWRRR